MDGTQQEAAPAPPGPARLHADWEARIMMVERMLVAFRLERFAYLTLSVVACAVLLVTSWRLFDLGDRTAALAIFGSSGVLTLALGRVLHMWNQAWKLVAGGDR